MLVADIKYYHFSYYFSLENKKIDHFSKFLFIGKKKRKKSDQK